MTVDEVLSQMKVVHVVEHISYPVTTLGNVITRIDIIEVGEKTYEVERWVNYVTGEFFKNVTRERKPWVPAEIKYKDV